MKKKRPSQLMDLFLSVAEELGFTSDKDVASLADVGPENITNWKSGTVKEFKTQKFLAAKNNLVDILRSMRTRAGLLRPEEESGLHPLEIEEGSSPSDLQRQFRDRVAYDYLGHRFLYFDPQGALAWEKLIGAGYEQDSWLEGVRSCARSWLETKKNGQGQASGPLAHALRLAHRDKPRGLDVVSLGPGEGGKEVQFLRHLLEVERGAKQGTRWLSFAPVDVSIPLLLTAAKDARKALFSGDDGGHAYRSVLPFCADFEEGNLSFANRLRTSMPYGQDGMRLILILGNVLGNFRDEARFVRKKLWQLARPGDMVWIEVGLRPERLEAEPLFRLTQQDRTVTAAETNRRLLLEGPYRRFYAVLGRPTPQLDLKVWVRENDDASRVPGSVNFCHDLIIKDEGRACTMLYSRRYELEQLTTWFESFDFDVLGIQRTRDSQGTVRVAHMLLQRK